MAMVRTPRQLVTQASALKYHNLGDIYIQPATTTSMGQRVYKYVKYDDGTANITANTQQLLVPKGSDLNIYTADKTDISSRYEGRFAAVCRADVTTTSNKYIWVQIGGEAHTHGPLTTVVAKGDALVAGTTDKVPAVISLAGITATTTELIDNASIFAIANATATTAAGQVTSFNMIGYQY